MPPAAPLRPRATTSSSPSLGAQIRRGGRPPRPDRASRRRSLHSLSIPPSSALALKQLALPVAALARGGGAGISSSAPMDTLHPNKDKKRSTRPKSHHEGKHDATEDIYYTIIDKCKTTKKSIYSDDFEKVSSKNPEETFEQHDSVIKGKRRFSLISKLQENYEKEKEKEATLQEKSTEVKNDHEIECTTSAVKERSRSIDVTTIDTSIDGWKATKKLTYRGGWKVADKKSMVASKQEEQEEAYEEEEKEKVTASQD